MNYMRIIGIKSVEPEKVVSEVYFSEREEFFRDHYEFMKIVPPYVIHEAIFQTAGRMVRSKTGNKYAGTIASFSNFDFKRPILPYEKIEIVSTLLSINDKSCFALISVNGEDETLLPSGKLILTLDGSLVSDKLNNKTIQDIKNDKKHFEIKS